MLFVEKGGDFGRKGKGTCDSATLRKSVDVKKERKRRLILQSSDSERDDYFISPRRKAEDCSYQNGDGPIVMKHVGAEHRKEAEIEGDKNQVMRSDNARSGSDKKRLLSGSEKKRNRELPGDEKLTKKIKTGSLKDSSNGQVKGSCRNKLKSDSVQCDYKVYPAGRERDGLKTKGRLVLNSSSNSTEEKIRRRDYTRHEKVRGLKASDVVATRAEGDDIRRKGIRLQAKSGVLKVYPSKKKVGGVEKVQICQGDEEKSKRFESPGVAKSAITFNQPDIYRERKSTERSDSSTKVGKSRASLKKISPTGNSKANDQKVLHKAGTDTSHQLEIEQENVIARYYHKRPKVEKSRSFKLERESDFTSSRRDLKDVNMLDRKCDQMFDGEHTHNSSLKSKHIVGKANAGRSNVKQKVRDQIKQMLLSAGWTIELRPRRSRAYEDSVYVSPQGTGYWSITKAYAVFQEQLNLGNDGKCKDVPESSPEERDLDLGGTSHPFPAITKNELDLLKRNVINRRKSKGELEDTEKYGESGSKMARLGSAGRNSIEESKRFSSLVVNSKAVDGFVAHKHLMVERTKQRTCALVVRGTNQEEEDEMDDYIPYDWKRTVLSWMIDLGVVHERGKVKYMNKKRTRAKLEGRITRDGIHCSCCSKILTVWKFELHAGSKEYRPYENIFVEDAGVSLLQCQLNAWKKLDESERRGLYSINLDGDPNDDTCGICGDGGDLICCDGCPSTFHLSCLGIQMLPPGEWHCTNCVCRFCGSVSSAATPQLLSCSQCEKKYHQDCMPEVDYSSVPPNNGSTSFCGQSCRMVFKQLKKLLGVKNDLEAGFSWRLIRRFDEDSLESLSKLSQRVECNSKIAVAFAVMDECFRPITDPRSGINLIHNVVYNCGSNIHRLNYCGFYTFILERGDEIISAASIRIHGTRLAEMPFIGTRNMYRRKGMCRRLLYGIESALRSLNVEKLVIPAIAELKDTWTTVFSFKPLEKSQELEIRSVNLLVFPDTGLLQKQLPRKDYAEKHMASNISDCVNASNNDKGESDKMHHQTLAEDNRSSAPVEPNLHTSDDIVNGKYEVKDAQIPIHKSAESATNGNSLTPESVRHNECVEQLKSEVRDELHSEAKVDDTLEIMIVNTDIVAKPVHGSDTSSVHSCEAKQTQLGDISSAKQESQRNAASDSTNIAFLGDSQGSSGGSLTNGSEDIVNAAPLDSNYRQKLHDCHNTPDSMDTSLSSVFPEPKVSSSHSNTPKTFNKTDGVAGSFEQSPSDFIKVSSQDQSFDIFNEVKDSPIELESCKTRMNLTALVPFLL
uniref:PHD-type domain-containing protein n=1 Tax=Ananas comosus var. bracteatus TaxID=296719 RepID=A0A6V7NN95_ANACO|nr:unnamed protein product [Ananas comosus var. bracteatus]